MSFVHFPTDTLSSLSKFLSFFSSPSLTLRPSPPPPLAVKVILIKSSRRTELLIAPGRSSWFQIQIKAHRFLPSSSASCPPFLHLPSSPLFHHVKYNLRISHVDCHSLTWASITSQDRGGEMKGKLGVFFSSSWSQDDFQLAHVNTHMHTRALYLFRNVQLVILGPDKWGVHEVRSFYKYLCVLCVYVCISLCLSSVFRTDSSLQAGKSLTAL